MSGRELKDMTLEELWQLFPIELAEHSPEWEAWAEEEAERLRQVLAEWNPAVSHVGSTAIEGIMAKPIVDLLVEVGRDCALGVVGAAIEGAGYTLMSASARRMSFNKGYTPEGYAGRVFHLHLRRRGDNDEIAFRDYLRSHGEAAREYEALKLSLLPRYRNDRDGYTAAKTEFVGRIMALAGKGKQQDARKAGGNE